MRSGPRRPNLRSIFGVDSGTWRASKTYVILAILCKSCTYFDSRKASKTCQGHIRLAVSGSIAGRNCARVSRLTDPCVSSIELIEIA